MLHIMLPERCAALTPMPRTPPGEEYAIVRTYSGVYWLSMLHARRSLSRFTMAAGRLREAPPSASMRVCGLCPLRLPPPRQDGRRNAVLLEEPTNCACRRGPAQRACPTTGRVSDTHPAFRASTIVRALADAAWHTVCTRRLGLRACEAPGAGPCVVRAVRWWHRMMTQLGENWRWHASSLAKRADWTPSTRPVVTRGEVETHRLPVTSQEMHLPGCMRVYCNLCTQ